MNIRSAISYLSNNLLLRWNKTLKLFRGFYEHQHQLTSTTSSNRYPELFSEVKRIYHDRPSVQNEVLLSFGCSTGEECFSLRQYFGVAKIIGMDINKINLLKARRANVDRGIVFMFSDKNNIIHQGPYDIIFCLSVLCRWNDTEFVDNCEDIYPFSKYEETVTLLTNNLKSEGLLVIYNSNFRFEESQVFSLFEIIQTPLLPDSGFVHKFNASNIKIRDAHRAVVYRKK
jgi:hypothetical protein